MFSACDINSLIDVRSSSFAPSLVKLTSPKYFTLNSLILKYADMLVLYLRVDLMRVDLLAIDLVRIDLVKGSPLQLQLSMILPVDWILIAIFKLLMVALLDSITLYHGST